MSKRERRPAAGEPCPVTASRGAVAGAGVWPPGERLWEEATLWLLVIALLRGGG